MCTHCGKPQCGLSCTALAAVPVAIDRIAPDGTILWCNEANAQLRGYDVAAIVGTKVWDHLAAPHDRGAVQQLIEHIVDQRPEPTPVAVNTRRGDGSVVAMLVDWRYEVGADGELLGFVSVVRDVGRDGELRTALQRIGLILIEQGIVTNLASLDADEAQVPGLSSLSPREREVVDLLAKGYRAPAIARRLHISPNTVRNHLKKAYQKLGVHSQEQLLDLVTGRE